MRNTKLIFLVAMTMVIIAVSLTFFVNKQGNLNLEKETSTPGKTILSPQINSEGLVTIKVTPKDLSLSASSWDFEVVLDTHSGNLDYDLTANSVLLDDKGNVFVPTIWEGDPPDGHHRTGVLKFETISPSPKSVELKINQVGDISERSFKWELSF